MIQGINEQQVFFSFFTDFVFIYFHRYYRCSYNLSTVVLSSLKDGVKTDLHFKIIYFKKIEGYSLDQIKMTEWIWPKLVSMTEKLTTTNINMVNMTKNIINITTTTNINRWIYEYFSNSGRHSNNLQIFDGDTFLLYKCHSHCFY